MRPGLVERGVGGVVLSAEGVGLAVVVDGVRVGGVDAEVDVLAHVGDVLVFPGVAGKQVEMIVTGLTTPASTCLGKKEALKDRKELLPFLFFSVEEDERKTTALRGFFLLIQVAENAQSSSNQSFPISDNLYP